MKARDLQSFIDVFEVPVLVIGGTGQVVAANGALEALLGAGLVGRHFITALRQPALVDRVERAMETRAVDHGTYLGREGDRDTTYRVRIAPVADQVVLTFDDRTAAEEVGQLRRNFVANVSHELRTPLTALSGFIETLRGPARDDPDARARFLEIMERETARMSRLVSDLLSLSRVEENERRRPRTQVVPGDLMRATLAEMSPVIADAGQDVALEDQSGGARVPGDEGQLRQVFGNLVENAVKYGDRDAPITITLGAVEDQPNLRQRGLRITVANGGPGLDAHHLPRLTERFYRVDAHRSRSVGGTGLGLAIVKHIVNRHRGRLQFRSAPGEGMQVAVTLPAEPDGDRAGSRG